MPIITLTLSNAAAVELTTTICEMGGYRATLPDGSQNPQSPAEFAKAYLVTMLRRFVIEHRNRIALDAVDVTPADIAAS
jgi:hypothetical protein